MVSLSLKRIRVVKGGPGSGYFDHPGRPGKVGGSFPMSSQAPGGVAYEAFSSRVLDGDYRQIGQVGHQGMQAMTTIVELEGGMKAIKKRYPLGSQMGAADGAAYEIAQLIGIDSVPMTVTEKDNVSYQRFANNSIILTEFLVPWAVEPGNVEDIDKDQIEDLYILDVVIGNGDRHKGNVMIHNDTQRLSFIDHSTTLYSTWFNPSSPEAFQSRVRSTQSNTESMFKHVHNLDNISADKIKGISDAVHNPQVATILMKYYQPAIASELYNKMIQRVEALEIVHGVVQKGGPAYYKKEDYQDSVMIALPVDDAEIRRLWKSYGGDEDILPLHVTMLYLGKVDDLDKEAISSKLQLFADNQSSIEGEYGGAAVFNDHGDGYPLVLLFDSPQLPFAFAKLAGMLKGLRPDLLHGFTPHTTLAYMEERPEQMPAIDTIPYRFNNLLLRWGDEDILFSLKGDIIEKGGEGSGHHGHLGRPGKQGGSLPKGSLPVISSDKKDVELSRQLGQECRSQSKECYKNSVMALVRVPGGKYVEGYFIIDMDGFQYPIEHGWIDKDGTIIDVTLPDDTGIYIPANTWTFTEAFKRASGSGSGSLLPFSNYNDENWRKAAVQAWDMLGMKIEKGGEGSGHHGHTGRPGKVGGSAPSGKKRVVSSKPTTSKDTTELYRNADGSWTPEREALHEEIINHFFEGKTPVDEPISFVLGGGTAAGKSTIVAEHYASLPENMVLANSDEVKAMLPEYEGGANASGVHGESSYLSKRIAYTASHSSYNVIMDGTGDGEIPQLKKKIASMKPLDQAVIGIYVTVDIETAVKRSMARAKATGRYVPESVIRQSHRMVAKIYPEIISGDLYDNVNLFDNSGSSPKLIAREVGTSFEVLDDKAYKRFLERGK